MRTLLVLLGCLWMVGAAKRDVDCTFKQNITGPLDAKMAVCELRYVKFTQGKKLIFGEATKNRTSEEPELICVRFLESNIQSIPNTVFRQFKLLESLELIGVGLRNIFQRSFDGADNLKTLQAFNNKITIISAYVFLGASNLENLDLSSNLITNIHNEAFSGLTHLKQLSLSNNRLSVIDEQTFHPLKNLGWLWLDRNYLKIIALNLLAKCENLEGIYLQGNKISAVSTVLFDKLPKLNFLFLADNNCTDQNFVNTKISNNSNVKKELSTCFEEFRSIVPDEEDNFRLKNVLRNAEKANIQCEADKKSIMEKLEAAKKQLESLEKKKGST